MRSDEPTTSRMIQTELPPLHTRLPFLQPPVVVSQPAGADLLAIAASDTGKGLLLAQPLFTGDPLSFPLEADSALIIAIADQALIFTASGRIFAYDSTARSMTPLADCPGERYLHGAAMPGNDSCVMIAENGDMVELSLPDCRTQRRIPLGESKPYAATALANGRALIWCDNGRCAILSPHEDSLEWYSLPALHIAQAIPLDGERIIIVPQGATQPLLLDVRDGSVQEAYTPLPEGENVHCIAVSGETLLASGRFSGSLYSWNDGSWECRSTPQPFDPLLFTALPDGRVAGVTYHGRGVLTTVDWRMCRVSPLPADVDEGLRVAALGRGPDRMLYIASSLNMRIGSWDPFAEKAGACFMASSFPGAVTALGFAGDRLLMGLAPDGAIMAHYPDLPVRLRDNPNLLGRNPAGRCRPLGPMVHHGPHVFCAFAAVDAGEEGGLLRINPLDNTLDSFSPIVPGHNVTGVVVDRLNDCLVIGVENESTAGVAMWSPYETRTLAVHTPFNNALRLRVWAAEGGRVYLTDGGARLAVLNSATGQLELQHDFPLGPITSLITNQEGALYGLAGGYLFRLHAEGDTIEKLAEAEGEMLTEIGRSIFAYTRDGRVYQVQLW